jgi:CheY-like chemotaxis protein
MKKTIMVVDDDAVALKALGNKLDARGYAVLPERDLPGVLARLKAGATSPEGTLEDSPSASEAANPRPDLILLDIGFPPEIGDVPWDGFLIVEWLKRMGQVSEIPVIFISDRDPVHYEAKARAAGAIACFRKPVPYEELFGVIQETLAKDFAAGPTRSRSFIPDPRRA